MLKRNRATKKRGRNQNDMPPKKQRRPESPDALVEMKNITDINDDCLEHIFKYLTIDDLLNAFDSCKLLQKAAHLAFTRKYRRHTVHLESALLRSISNYGKGIWISRFPACLKVMRCFGDLITKLEFSKWFSERKRDELDRYLNEYCAESVVDLKYGGVHLENLTKPFTKVESVRFDHLDFACEPADLNRCFPNLRAFAMLDSNSVDFVLAHIPNLEHLEIDVSGDQHDKLATILQLNPQLQTLFIRGFDLDVQFLRFISECPQLEFLSIWSIRALTVDTNNDPIHFKSVREFDAKGSDLQKLYAANIPITFDQLDELKIWGYNDVDENVIRFVSKNSTISKFTYCREEDMSEETVLEFAKALPSVKELRFLGTNFSAGDVITFITKCPSLNYIQCNLFEYNRLKNMMGAEWRSSTDGNYLIELQRSI